MEEIRDITFGLWGEELSHQQTIQRIVGAGFPIKNGVALTMFAIVEGESGEYQKAWHANVDRDPEDASDAPPYQGPVVRYVIVDDVPERAPEGTQFGPGVYMRVNSIDLGFMQRSVTLTPKRWVETTETAARVFVEGMFDQYPYLAVPWSAAEDAYDLWVARGFKPWFAYKPGDPKFRLKKRYGSLAFARWLIQSFVGPDPETGKLPRVDYV